MGSRIMQGKCKDCGVTKVEVKTPNHILHLLLCCFTCGLWFIVWMWLSSFSATPRCFQCGKKLGGFWRLTVK